MAWYFSSSRRSHWFPPDVQSQRRRSCERDGRRTVKRGGPVNSGITPLFTFYTCERGTTYSQNLNPYACVRTLYPTPTVNRWRIISRKAVDDLSICQFEYLWDGIYILICLSRLLVHSMPGWLSWLPLL